MNKFSILALQTHPSLLANILFNVKDSQIVKQLIQWKSNEFLIFRNKMLQNLLNYSNNNCQSIIISMDERTSQASSIKGQSFYFMFFLKWICISDLNQQHTEQQMEPKIKFEIFKGPQIINSIKQPVVLDMKKGWCKGEKVEICFFLKDFNPYRQIQFDVKISQKTGNGQEAVGELKIRAGKYIEAFTNQKQSKLEEIGSFGAYRAGFLIFTQKSRHSLQKIVKGYKQSLQNNEKSVEAQIQALRQKILEETKKESGNISQIKQDSKIQINEEANQKEIMNKQENKKIQSDSKVEEMNEEKVDAEIQKIEQQNQLHNTQQIEQNRNQEQKIQNQGNNEQKINDTEEVVQLIEIEQNLWTKQPEQKQGDEQVEKKKQQLPHKQINIKQQVDNELQHITSQVQKKIQIEQPQSVNAQLEQPHINVLSPKNKQNREHKMQKLSQTPKHSKQNQEEKQRGSPQSQGSFTEMTRQSKQSKAQHVQKVELEQIAVKKQGMSLSLKLIIFLLITGFIGFAAFYVYDMNKLVDEHQTVSNKRKAQPTSKSHQSTGSPTKKKK